MSKEIFQPNEAFSKNARVGSMDAYNALMNEAKADYEGFWAKYADEKIDWFKPYSKVLDESDAPFYKWFVDGKLNVANQCVDRHLADKADKTAILFEGDRGDVEKISYEQLSKRVNKFANQWKFVTLLSII